MKNDYLRRIVREGLLPDRLVRERKEGAARVIEDLLRRQREGRQIPDSGGLLAKTKRELKDFLYSGRAVELAVLAPVGVWGGIIGGWLPDTDISILGIGVHRYFLFHSTFGLLALRYLYSLWCKSSQHGKKGLVEETLQKIAGVVLGTCAFGVGIHLLVDAFQPKAVVFPFFGSLIDGTFVDDNIWLLGNSLWAFKIGADLFAFCLADELAVAKRWVRENFGGAGDGRLAKVLGELQGGEKVVPCQSSLQEAVFTAAWLKR
ncbi:MAG: hypothetical protein PWQ91_350 [Eubacteriales bacterium]|nr:hypothetical protein [Eubacteriales bacterium]